MESLVNWAQIVGCVLALLAVILASVQLMRSEAANRQSRADLREDRRFDFLMSLLIDLAVAVQGGFSRDGITRRYAEVKAAAKRDGASTINDAIVPAVLAEIQDAMDELLDREAARR